MLRFLRREPGFYQHTWQLALPIMLQNLITTSLGFVDTFMVGLLGQAELSAVTAANTVVYLVQTIIFGLLSGLAILVSQYWGRHDTESINRCMGVALYTGVSIAAAVALTLFFFPQWVMSLVTDNRLLIGLGAPYLRLVGISYVFNTATSVYVGVQRSTENPSLGLTVFTTSMVLNTFLNYILIFGKFGAPALGITGAAAATLAARVVEFLLTFGYALGNKRIPLRPAALFRPGTALVRDFVKYSIPVLVNDSLWGLGTTVITAIIGHMAISEEMLAAYAIMGNIEKFATVACWGVSGAAAVIIGKRIGEGASKDQVYDVGWCLLLLSLLLGLAGSLCLAILLPTVFIPYLYPLFHLADLSMQIAVTMCVVFILIMPTKAFDITLISGILRAGGDVRMAAIIDVGSLWGLAVTATALTALVFDAPVALVCLGIQAEGLSKMPLGIWRIRSRKWINDVTREEPV